jgi:hypothetical protein
MPDAPGWAPDRRSATVQRQLHFQDVRVEPTLSLVPTSRACVAELQRRSRPQFFQRATGLPWNLTYTDAPQSVRDGESGHLQVAIKELGKVPAERLHPKAAYSRCRPICDIGLRRLTTSKPSLADHSACTEVGGILEERASERALQRGHAVSETNR